MQENSRLNFDVQYNPSRKTKLLLMGLLAILNIIIRIPSIPHEKGADSFMIHALANSVSIAGSAKWWLNWLSVFGSYAASYASAVPFSLSGISQVTGIEMEKTILLFCLIIGLFGMYTGYVFAGRIYDNFLFKYIMSLFFSLSPGLMVYTTWEVSTRGQFIVFLPLFLYILLKEDLGIKKYILLFICFIFIFSTHHYAFFLLPISIIYILLKIVQKLKPELLEKQSLNYLFPIFFILNLMSPFFTGMFIESGSRYSWIIDSVTTNIRQSGPLALLIPGGMLYLFLKKKNFAETFICVLMISMAPIFYSLIYGPFILLLIAILLINISFNNLLKAFINHRHKLMTLSVVASILLFVAFSSFYNHYRTGGAESFWYMQESTYNSGIWAKNHVPENTLGYDTSMETERLFAVSGPHPITTADDTVALTYGFINESNIVVANNSPSSLSYYFDGPYVIKSGTPLAGSIEWVKYTAQNIADLRGFDYYIQDKEIISHMPVDETVRRSESDLILDGPRISIWKIPHN